MKFEKIAVIGGGTMGNGIAQVVAVSGRRVALIDVSADALGRAKGAIEKSLEKLVAKEKITTADRDAALRRIETSTGIKAVAGADLVVEAVVENLEAKRAVFTSVVKLVSPATILASNTSSISITELAAVVPEPGRVIGMHFMNPVPLMKLVEIVRGVRTDERTVQSIEALTKDLGKVPVIVNDYPGFISNRVLMPMINEAVYCLMEGVADRDAIDTIMKLGMAHPMGPLALADLIGLDVCLHIMDVLQHGLGDSKYRACPMLRNLVAAGKLGRKSGEGFYTYE